MTAVKTQTGTEILRGKNAEGNHPVQEKQKAPVKRASSPSMNKEPFNPDKFKNNFKPEDYSGVLIDAEDPQVWHIIDSDQDPAIAEHWTENEEPAEGKAFFCIDQRGRGLEHFKARGQYPPFVLEFPQHFDGVTPKPKPPTTPWHLRAWTWTQIKAIRGFNLCQRTFRKWFPKQQPKEESHTKES